MHRMNAVYFMLRFWTNKNGITSLQIFYCTYYTSFIVLLFLGAFEAGNDDEVIFLAVATVVGTVKLYRMYCIVWKQNEIFKYMHSFDVDRTNDFEVFSRANQKLKKMMSFASFFMWMMFFALLIIVSLPFVFDEKILIFNVAFPLDYKTNPSAFWVAHVYVSMGTFLSLTCCFFVITMGYLMMKFVIKYEILGSQFKNLGKVGTGKVRGRQQISIKEQNGLYLRNFIEAIKNHDKIYEYRHQHCQYSILNNKICCCLLAKSKSFRLPSPIYFCFKSLPAVFVSVDRLAHWSYL